MDCLPPVISNVQTSNVQLQSARVNFQTDELTRGAVRYGLSCDTLVETATFSQLATTLAIDILALQSNTTYFYAVEAEDQAGNVAVDDNGGACYTFRTLDAHTERFEGDFDLAFTTLTFQPDGSSVLHGLHRGDITFNQGDTDYTETFADHFRLPRVAALFDDLNPSLGGQVSWKQLADRAAVTWLNVPEYGLGNQNSFQIELFFDGRISITHLAIASADSIIGLSEGAGLPAEFIESNLSAVDACAAPPAPCRGDCNCDGNVGFADIDFFVAAIPDNEVAWAAMFAPDEPTCAFASCDVNGSGNVGFDDIDPFVALIPSACP